MIFCAAAIVAIANLLAFSPTVTYEFTNWDDDAFISRNPLVVQPGSEWVVKALKEPHEGYYAPTLWLTLRAWRGVFGLKPGAFHLLTVLFHAANAAILLLLLSRMGAGLRGAFAGALLWSLHPLRVESVAWVTELKDTESGFFALLSALLFLHSLRLGQTAEMEKQGARQAAEAAPEQNGRVGGKSRNGRIEGITRPALYFGSAVCAALSMGAKGTLCVWPLAIILIALLPCRLRNAGRGRPDAKEWLAMGRIGKAVIPHATLGVIFGIVMFESQSSLGVVPEGWTGAWKDQMARAAYSFAFHLRLHVWPVGLSALYRWPEYLHGNRAWMSHYLPGVFFCAVYAAAFYLSLREAYRSGAAWACWAAFAMLFYACAMLPMSQVIPTARPLADRYTYIPGIGLFAAAGALAFHTRPGSVAKPGRALAFAALAVCATVETILTIERLPTWRNSVSLWRDVVLATPNTAMAHSQLAAAMMEKGMNREAEAELKRALEIEPQNILAIANMGLALAHRGQFDEAIKHLAVAVELEPSNFNARYGLIDVLLRAGRLKAAESQLPGLLALKEWQPGRYCKLALDFRGKGRLAAAADSVRRAIGDSPGNASYWNILGACLLEGGDAEGAVAAFMTAARLAPGNGDFRDNLEKARRASQK
ncbi:MAG TPA: tetratricopeptide repeat protein [Candidatus Brocadiia bacterium]|nr:tetratricopeptide repeat protein [Candidatus Brocadiia bacterium]